jgi:hypothetical protein
VEVVVDLPGIDRPYDGGVFGIGTPAVELQGCGTRRDQELGDNVS